MTWRKRLQKWLPILTIFNIVIAICLAFWTAWVNYRLFELQASLYDLQVQGLGANVSILINPRLNQNWTFVLNGAYFTVNGTFSNDGSRPALIEQLELAMIYNFSNGDEYTLTRTYLDPSNECGWINSTISRGEVRPFSLTVFFYEGIAVNSRTGQVIGIGDSRSDKFGVHVRYDDGLGELDTVREYNAKG